MSVLPRPRASTRLRERLGSPAALKWAVPVFVAIWPFLFHAPVAFRVWHGGFQHIGSDFSALYYPYKPYLLAAMAHGTVPLWMPQEAGGFPFALNPFTQSLYPGNLIILPIARLLGHWGPLQYQWYALAAISVLALSVYLFLRKVGLSLLPAALAAIVVASNYKVTESLRFPNATHAIACASVAVVAIAYLRVAHRIAARVTLAALLALSIFSLATAGYPYFFVYFFLLLPPLLLWLELGATAGYRAQRIGFGTYIGTTLAAIGVGLVAVWPYLSGMQHVLAQTTDRAGGDWAYSTGHHFDGFAYVASLMMPDRSSFEGWFYFGTAGLVVVALAVYVVAREEGLRRHSRLIAVTGLWFAWIVFFGLNGSNPLFRFAWETLPVIDTMRVWGRINIFLVFPLAITLGLALEVVVRRYAGQRIVGVDARRAAGFAALVAIAVAGLQVAIVVTQPKNPDFVQALLVDNRVPPDAEYIVFTVMIAALLAGTLAAMRSTRGRPVRRVQGLCAVLAFVWLWQIHGAAPWSWMWLSKPIASNASPLDLRVGDVALATLAEGAVRTERLAPSSSPGFDPDGPWATAVYANWHFARYVRFLHDRRISDDTRNRLLGVTSPSRLFFAAGPPDAGALERGAVDLRAARASVEYYDGSRLVAAVRARAPGELVFADNWDRGWRATVDGRRVPIERAFGTFKAVRIPRGASRVEFSYCPFSAPVYRALC